MYKNKENLGYLVDKIAVKHYVQKILGQDIIIPTYRVFNNVEEIDWSGLPNQFVLKLNHGSGWNIICEDKSRFDIKSAEINLKKWQQLNYYNIGKELPYKSIIPRIICEEYLSSSTPLIDYKIFCFDGHPKYIQVDLDRQKKHKRNFFTTDWKVLPFTTLYPMGDGLLKKPNKLREMLVIAKKLSQNMPFVRVDLYYNDNNIYFGEITFHHGGGFEPFIPKRYDYILGKDISISNKTEGFQNA